MPDNQTDDRLRNLFSHLKVELEATDPSIRIVHELSPFSASEIQVPVTGAEDSCPFIKAVWDPTIRYGFPNQENFCYKQKKPAPIPLEDQEQQCLTHRYFRCPVYKFSQPKRKLWEVVNRLLSTG